MSELKRYGMYADIPPDGCKCMMAYSELGEYVKHYDHISEIAKLKALMLELQWSAVYSYCTGWSCCPICKGIKPPQGMLNGELPNNSGHRDNCRLSEAAK